MHNPKLPLMNLQFLYIYHLPCSRLQLLRRNTIYLTINGNFPMNLRDPRYDALNLVSMKKKEGNQKRHEIIRSCGFCLLFLRLSLIEMKGKSSSYDQSYLLLNSIGEFIRFISKCVHKRRVVAVCLRLITKFVNPAHGVHSTVFEQITACFWIRWGRTTKDTRLDSFGNLSKVLCNCKTRHIVSEYDRLHIRYAFVEETKPQICDLKREQIIKCE